MLMHWSYHRLVLSHDIYICMSLSLCELEYHSQEFLHHRSCEVITIRQPITTRKYKHVWLLTATQACHMMQPCDTISGVEIRADRKHLLAKNGVWFSKHFWCCWAGSPVRFWTHWLLRDAEVILQVYFSKSFYELISWALPNWSKMSAR